MTGLTGRGGSPVPCVAENQNFAEQDAGSDHLPAGSIEKNGASEVNNTFFFCRVQREPDTLPDQDPNVRFASTLHPAMQGTLLQQVEDFSTSCVVQEDSIQMSRNTPKTGWRPSLPRFHLEKPPAGNSVLDRSPSLWKKVCQSLCILLATPQGCFNGEDSIAHKMKIGLV